MADGLIFGFDGKYKVHSLFAFPDFQLKFNPNPIKGLLVVMGKPVRNIYLRTIKHD